MSPPHPSVSMPDSDGQWCFPALHASVPSTRPSVPTSSPALWPEVETRLFGSIAPSSLSVKKRHGQRDWWDGGLPHPWPLERGGGAGQL